MGDIDRSGAVDLRPASGSPLIDAGTNGVPGMAPVPATDLDGNPRVVDGNHDGVATLDIGAYERQ